MKQGENKVREKVKEKDKEVKKVVSIFVRTSADVLECKERILSCLVAAKLDPKKVETTIILEHVDIYVPSGAYDTHVLVVGEGWSTSVMAKLCKCLESTGYLIQAVLSSHSYVPIVEKFS